MNRGHRLQILSCFINLLRLAKTSVTDDFDIVQQTHHKIKAKIAASGNYTAIG